jgi:hypothetical protein
MVINYLDLVGVAVAPLKADSPLIVDADAVLASAVACQFFQPIAWGDTKIIQYLGCIHQQQFPQCDSLQWTCELLDGEAMEKGFGLLIAETTNHGARS